MREAQAWYLHSHLACYCGVEIPDTYNREFLPISLQATTIASYIFFIVKLIHRKAEFSHNSAFRLFMLYTF